MEKGKDNINNPLFGHKGDEISKNNEKHYIDQLKI
jgi:hypothetical protein